LWLIAIFGRLTRNILQAIYHDYFMHHVPTRAGLLAALDDPNSGNPLATAIAAVITSYGNALTYCVTTAELVCVRASTVNLGTV
jgi:hypothetical protein